MNMKKLEEGKKNKVSKYVKFEFSVSYSEI